MAGVGDFRALWAWYAAEFLSSYACTLLTAGSYDYASRELKASASAGLWLSAAWGFAYIFIALLAGQVCEKWGPRKSVLVVSAASAPAALVGLLAIGVPAVWMVLLVMLPYNFTSTMIWPAIESGLSRTRVGGGGRMGLSARMALFNVSWGSAGFAAFFTRGALEGLWWGMIFLLPAAAHVLAWIILRGWGVSAADIGKGDIAVEGEERREGDAARVSPRRAQSLLRMAWLGNTLAYVAIYVLIPLLAKLAQAAGMGSLAGGGMITSVWSFTRFAGFALVWVWAGWHYQARWLIGAMALLAGSFFVMLTLTVHLPGLLVAMQILFGLSAALIYSSALYYAMHVSRGHGGHAAIHEAVIGLGIFIGPTIGALAGSGEMDAEALARIGMGVTGLLLAGLGLMTWMAWRVRGVAKTDKLAA